MKKMLLVLLLCLTTGAFFLLKSKKEVAANDSCIIVGTNPNFPPFEFKENGELKGFDIELITELSKRTNKKIEFKELAFDTLLLEIQFGHIHAIASAMTPTPDRSQKVLFTKHYLAKDPLVVVTNSDNRISKLSDLDGKEVVVNDGYTAEAFMMKHKTVSLKRLTTPAEAFLSLTTGRSYAYVSARSAVQPFFDRYGMKSFSVFEIPDAFDSYSFAVSKKHPELLKLFQNALSDMEKDGSLQTMKQKWHLVW